MKVFTETANFDQIMAGPLSSINYPLKHQLTGSGLAKFLEDAKYFK